MHTLSRFAWDVYFVVGALIIAVVSIGVAIVILLAIGWEMMQRWARGQQE